MDFDNPKVYGDTFISDGLVTMNITTDDDDSHGDHVKGQQYCHLLSGTLFAS